jgi:hypothetical protein
MSIHVSQGTSANIVLIAILQGGHRLISSVDYRIIGFNDFCKCFFVIFYSNQTVRDISLFSDQREEILVAFGDRSIKFIAKRVPGNRFILSFVSSHYSNFAKVNRFKRSK